MTYEEELAAFIQRANDEERSAIHAVACAGSFMEMVKLEKEFKKLKRQHDKEFCELRAKYNLPTPKRLSPVRTSKKDSRINGKGSGNNGQLQDDL